MIKINDNIKKIRRGKDFTQQIMADKLGLSLSAYSNIESGKADVNMTRITEISKIFEMTPVELITLNTDQAISMGKEFKFDTDGAMKQLYEHIVEQNKTYIETLRTSIEDLREKAELYKELYEGTKLKVKAPKEIAIPAKRKAGRPKRK
ncbi:MAG: helix-turn-helix transcriptional regulator [Bacteroidetes bacterium]|nr:helix-turn-helix transcriptional regulator [Bacteroidota bacterium]MBU1720642.1 helix-turn-helix transcriptional regulator [Bacteroidota bacterium]